MLLTVSGPAGSGKSTTAAALAEEFGLDHVSGGDIFRDLADERGYTVEEFNLLAEEDDQIDRDLDRRLYEIARSRDDVVVESRLAGWLAGDAATLKLWLDAPLDVRARRIADREDKRYELARADTRKREESEAKRYEEYYDIPIDDRSIYDLALNTARWSPEGVLRTLASAVETHAEGVDEGKRAIEGVSYDF